METIYLQLYSLGQYGQEHPMPECLETVAKMGYDGVEFAGNNYGELSAADLVAELKKNNLGCRSVHLSTGRSTVPHPPGTLKEAGRPVRDRRNAPLCERRGNPRLRPPAERGRQGSGQIRH